MELLLIDGIGPFFRHYRTKRTNWSKIPFAQIETDTGILEEYLVSVPEDFRTFASQVAGIGYNAITLDDMAHLLPLPDYPESLLAKIQNYRTLYRKLFAIAREEGLRIFITTDLIFQHHVLAERLRTTPGATRFFGETVVQLFDGFPEISGIITRFGETDGLDVQGDFHSRMLLRKPAEARRFLKQVLPIFEARKKLLIFRTWCVGAYPIGDLMWNRNTFDKVFKHIDSPSLIISMKYGESDFFRYLPINKLFFRSAHKKIVEFQARREYEGFGGYPSFVGWDCEGYLNELRAARNVVGASVWCQTGGWGKRRQLTFLRNSSIWVELNVFVIQRLCSGIDCDAAIREFAEEREIAAEPFIRFLRLSNDVIRDLLYMRELAQQKLFFRRLRLPPLLFVFWDRVLVSHTLKRFLKCLIADKRQCLEEGREAMQKLDQMRELAEQHALPRRGLTFQRDTFEIIALAREYFLSPYNETVVEQLRDAKKRYKKNYARNYAVMLDFRESKVGKRQLRWLVSILLRQRRGYRLIDQIFTLRVLAWLYPLIKWGHTRNLPKFARKQAMGVDVLFE